MLKVAPTLILEELEPSVAFFVDKLGFEKVAEVPHIFSSKNLVVT